MSATSLLTPVPTITIPRSAPITNMALQYNGGTDVLSVPGLLLGQTMPQMTIEAWFFLGTAGGPAPVTQRIWQNTDANNTAFFVGFQNTTLQFGYNSANVHSFNYPFTTNEWYYIVITYNVTASQITLYVNGLAQTPGTLTGPQPVKIGPANVGSPFLGNIGTIRVWRGLLDLAYVRRFMYMTLTGAVEAKNSTGQVIATLIGNWRCDEGYGSLAFDYLGGFNAVLGGGNPTNSPDWIVSTALKPPDFIGLAGNPVFTNMSTPLMVFSAPTTPVLIEDIEPEGGKPVATGRTERIAAKATKGGAKTTRRTARPKAKATKSAKRKGVKK